MWGTIANLKENLNKIALDVHQDDYDDDEELEIYGRPNGDTSPIFDRRNSHSFAHSKSGSRSPLSNGIDDPAAFNSEIEQYKAEIKRLQSSEAEIKALSVNYAALLKEKEDQIVRLNKENGSLKQNLEATSKASSVSRIEGSGASTNGTNTAKGSSDQLSSRQHKFTTQKNRHAGNQIQNGVLLKKDSINNGIMPALDSDLQGKYKELAELAEEKAAEIRKLKMELEQEHDKLANLKLKFQEEQTLNKSLQEELQVAKMEIDKVGIHLHHHGCSRLIYAYSYRNTSMEKRKIHDEVNEKASEVKRLQMELSRREDEDAANAVDSLKRLIKTLEKENVALKMEKNELEAALETSKKSYNKDSSSISEMPDPSKSFPEKEEMERSLQKLTKDLKETQRERDKALQQLTRLKQHLLEKEAEESQKMDEDSKIIEELRESNTFLRAQISHLEKSLKQAIASHEELKMGNSNEIQKSREIIDDLNKKLANCMSTIDAKNIELLNLQTALGQYYAEIEAKEHLEGELTRAREESAKLSLQLKLTPTPVLYIPDHGFVGKPGVRKPDSVVFNVCSNWVLLDAEHRVDVSRGEREEILARLSQSEKAQADWRSRVSKLEEDNAKLRRALEQSMTRLNRMSVDSDFLVDRRIVIKLLVTYFQRNHSKEVLDLMVRMLGFSDEDKQRIGGAQQGAGKGVVRGVLGLPGRLVGGILGGSPTEAAANVGSENQSFADMWVDFLLKETEEREKRDSAGTTDKSTEDSHGTNPNTTSVVPPFSNHNLTTGTTSPLSMNSSPNPNPSPPPRGYFQQPERLSSEFSTVPLTSSDSKPSSSKMFTRY
ncbi:golgin candidate 3-like isoform X1 [Senna tora]|uniref:Golgin candidate 3-like isoform X1 n=1 Tax=Senna tora TaxID=362788 RepID=A0A834VXZ1_9FABA|nr:golgin candidate 3-like isoform X1 [Senna tora]